MSKAADRVSDNAASVNPSCDGWKIVATLVTIAALGAISTGVMGFQGMEPFASFYGHIGSIAAMASGGLVSLIVLSIILCRPTFVPSKEDAVLTQELAKAQGCFLYNKGEYFPFGTEGQFVLNTGDGPVVVDKDALMAQGNLKKISVDERKARIAKFYNSYPNAADRVATAQVMGRCLIAPPQL